MSTTRSPILTLLSPLTEQVAGGGGARDQALVAGLTKLAVEEGVCPCTSFRDSKSGAISSDGQARLVLLALVSSYFFSLYSDGQAS